MFVDERFFDSINHEDDIKNMRYVDNLTIFIKTVLLTKIWGKKICFFCNNTLEHGQ